MSWGVDARSVALRGPPPNQGRKPKGKASHAEVGNLPGEDSFWGAENHGIVIWGLSMSPYPDGLHGEGIYMDSLVLKVNSNPAVVTTG